MSMHRTKATFIGLLEAGRVNEWVVTEKLGDTLKSKLIAKATTKLYTRFGQRYILNTLQLVDIQSILNVVTKFSLTFADSIGENSLLGYIYSYADATMWPMEDHTSMFICFYSLVHFLLLELVILAQLFQPFRLLDFCIYLRANVFLLLINRPN